jgi:NTE family protein
MRALVLSGGAVKGAYQLGVLKKWMFEDGIDYEVLCGVSVGAINASVLSQYTMGSPASAWSALHGLWSRVTNDNIRKDWTFFGKLAALWKPSIMDSTPLLKWIRSELNQKAIAVSGKKLRVGAVNWTTGEYKFATEEDERIAEWVAASSSYPVFMLPIEIDGALWSDGGIRNVTPLGEAIRLGADEIDVVMCTNPDLPSNWSTKDRAAVPGYTMRTLSLMGDEIIRGDLQICGLKNDIAELSGKYKKIKIRLVQPSINLVDDSLDFDPTSIRRMEEIGYEDACKGRAAP